MPICLAKNFPIIRSGRHVFSLLPITSFKADRLKATSRQSPCCRCTGGTGADNYDVGIS
jgi:hypothetical protein